jgi:hypothetical protein
MARQSAWNPRKKLQKGATFVHYTRDMACPFSPTPAEAKQLFENNAHKLVLLHSKDCAYGKQGHNYDREYLALAELEDFAAYGSHEVHTARMHVNVGDTQESLALLMVDLILTMGTKRLHSLLQDFLDSPDEATLPQLIETTQLKLTTEELEILNSMSLATAANTNKHTAWLWGTILPSISSRSAADAADKGHTTVPLFQRNAKLKVTLKFDHKLAHNSFLVYVTILGGQNDWATFQTDKTKLLVDRKGKTEYQTGIYAGDILTLQLTMHDFEHFENPLPEATRCQAFVLMKSRRKRPIPSQADVKALQLAIKFPAGLKLQQ